MNSMVETSKKIDKRIDSLNNESLFLIKQSLSKLENKIEDMKRFYKLFMQNEKVAMLLEKYQNILSKSQSYFSRKINNSIYENILNYESAVNKNTNFNADKSINNEVYKHFDYSYLINDFFKDLTKEVHQMPNNMNDDLKIEIRKSFNEISDKLIDCNSSCIIDCFKEFEQSITNQNTQKEVEFNDIQSYENYINKLDTNSAIGFINEQYTNLAFGNTELQNYLVNKMNQLKSNNFSSSEDDVNQIKQEDISAPVFK